MLQIQQIPDGITNEPRSKVYGVTLNGQEANIYNCRVSAYPFNRRWPGYQRFLSQTEIAGVLTFAADEVIEVEISFLQKTPKSACVRPVHAGVMPKICGNTIKFTLEKAGFYCLETDGSTKDVLHIFFNPIMEEVSESDVDLYFGAGSHHPGIIHVQSGQRIYVDMNAIVYGAFLLENVENVEIFGYGILDDAFEVRYDAYFQYVGNIHMRNCKNITVKGVTLRDSIAYVLHTYECEDISIENVKVVGQWKYNTDGFDFLSTSNVLVDKCFLRTFDDTICMKGCGFKKDTRNVTVRNCVLWNDWGKTLEIGYDSTCFHIDNILFENCDLIHNTYGAISISNGGGAWVKNVQYRNIRIEFSDYETVPMIQESDEHEYPFIPNAEYYAICVQNPPIWNSAYGGTMPTILQGYEGTCKVEDVLFENISIHTTGEEKHISLESINSGKNGDISNICFSNITLNGRTLTAEDFKRLDGAEVK